MLSEKENVKKEIKTFQVRKFIKSSEFPLNISRSFSPVSNSKKKVYCEAKPFIKKYQTLINYKKFIEKRSCNQQSEKIFPTFQIQKVQLKHKKIENEKVTVQPIKQQELPKNSYQTMIDLLNQSDSFIQKFQISNKPSQAKTFPKFFNKTDKQFYQNTSKSPLKNYQLSNTQGFRKNYEKFLTNSKQFSFYKIKNDL